MASVQPIPEGYHTVTPFLSVKGASDAIEFYKRAFGAVERGRMQDPKGSVVHAEIKIGDSVVMLADEMPGSECQSPQALGGTTTTIFLYVKDVDAVYNKAVAAGAKSTMPPADMFWGDRYGKVADPFGHSWSLATHKEDVAPDEMKRRSEAFMAKMAETQKTKTA